MIYVDDAQIPYGRMKMCHMLADTSRELLDMAKKIGIDPKHLERPGEVNEHFNLSMAYRAKAVKAGAVELNSRGLVKLIRQKRMLAEARVGEATAPIEEYGILDNDPEPEAEEATERGGVHIRIKPVIYTEHAADEDDDKATQE